MTNKIGPKEAALREIRATTTKRPRAPTGSVTINSRPIIKPDGSQLQAGDIPAPSVMSVSSIAKAVIDSAIEEIVSAYAPTQEEIDAVLDDEKSRASAARLFLSHRANSRRTMKRKRQKEKDTP